MYQSLASLLAAVLFVGTFGMNTPASAAETSDIGVVEVQLIMREALAGKSIQVQIESTRSSYEAAVLAEETRLRDLEQELVRQRSLLAPEAFADKRRDFENQVASHKRDVRARRRTLDQAYSVGVRQIQQAVTEIISEIAEQRNLMVVVPASQILFANPTLVITNDVLSELDEKLPDVTLDFSLN